MRKYKYTLICIPLILGLWAFVVEPGFRHHTKNYTLSVTDWKHDGYRIVVLADIHIGSPFNSLSKLESIVEMANSAKPDLILIAGDFVIHEVLGGTFVSPESMIPYLKKLYAKDGVFAVLGNHDHWLDAKLITAALESAGIPVLTNKAIQKNNFWLVGIDDFWTGKPDIEGTLATITNQDPIILFTHNPDIFVNVPERVGLTIAGHTHGGQVYIPLLGRPIVPSDYGERFAIGHIIEGNKQLFVNPGTGTSILPVRFLVPPEISVIELRVQ